MLLLIRAGSRRELLPLLAVSGLVQLGDAVLGVGWHNPGMLGSALGAAVHLGTV